MKKLFFFRSSTEKQGCVDHSLKSGLSNPVKKNDESLRRSLLKAQKHASENRGLDNNPCLRRSRSFSSAALIGDATAYRNTSCYSDHGSSPSSSGSVKAQKHNQLPRSCTLTPERHVKTKQYQEVCFAGHHGVHRRVPSCPSKEFNDSSGDSSLSSSNLSNDVLDLYIDGEQQNERCRHRRRTTSKQYNAKGGDKKPPRSHCTAPASPTGSFKGKSRSYSSRGKGSGANMSQDWVEAGFVQESPRDLAKHVIEKLCHTHISPRSNPKDYDSDFPITIEDVYNGSFNRNSPSKSKVTYHKGYQSDRVYLSAGESQTGDYQDFESNKVDNFCNTEDELDMELKCKLKEAQERLLLLSEEHEQERYHLDIDFNVPTLVQRIKELTEEKISLALDNSAILESHLTDRDSLKEQLSAARLELDSQTRTLEKEKNEIQATLEKELDRRSIEWSMKLEKFQEEEQRLRERVRELAEQNVSLQREVSSFQETETERRNVISFSEKQINDLTSMLENTQREYQDLCQRYRELQDRYKIAEESQSSILNSYEERQEACKDLQVCVTRLTRTCTEQEKTIDGLRGELAESIQKRFLVENSDKHAQKLQMELVRLTGVEQALRREVESYKVEADSLRCENINLLNRLKVCGKEGGSLAFKLDQELLGRLHYLERQGLSFFNNSTNLCSKLLDYIKRLGKKDGLEVNGNRLDAQFIIESEVKVQGFKRGFENLTKSLQNITTILEEKSGLEVSKYDAQCLENNSFGLQNELSSQDQTRSELKAEKLLTRLLREKLYAKDQEVEQLQAEVATAVRGSDILKCEVQNALDSLSCVTHRMKELEIQMIKKDDKINQLETDLQESTKDLAIIRGILPKVTEERDMMWEEVKQHTERNMLLNSEMNMLKKKIEALDEDVLLKEGQITILKDSLGKKSFDLLMSPDRTHEFLLE